MFSFHYIFLAIDIIGVCAIAFAIYELGLNIDPNFDISHGLHNDAMNAINNAGLKSHLLMTLLRLNVPLGPWQEDQRWKQVLGNALEQRKHGSPRDSVLFMSCRYGRI